MTTSENTTPAHQLNVADLHKEYPTPAEPLVVLHGVSLAARGGDSVAIVGPSGSGKSTLLNILGALDRPTDGTVRLDGEDPFAMPPRRLAAFRAGKVGFVFQDHHLLPQCTAVENVLLAALAAGGVSTEQQAHAGELLARVGLAERADHLPGELSGGERQRVAIARALMNSPTMLLCDEPTGNLDAGTAERVGELLMELGKQTGAVLLVVTHSTGLAGLCQRRHELHEGQLHERHD